MSIGYLDTVATALLDALADALVQATTGRPPPAKVYVSHGLPAHDGCCEGGQATVWLERVEYRPVQDGGGASAAGCVSDTWGTFVLEWARCVPTLDDTGAWPSEGDLDVSAGDLLEDLWAVLTELDDRRATGTLVPGHQLCQGINPGDAVPLEPRGACAGWQVRVDVALQGPGPTGS